MNRRKKQAPNPLKLLVNKYHAYTMRQDQKTDKQLKSILAGTFPQLDEYQGGDETGLLAGVKNPKALADNILRLIDNKDFKEKLVKNAKQQVIEEYSKEHTCEKTLAIYRQIISQK